MKIEARDIDHLTLSVGSPDDLANKLAWETRIFEDRRRVVKFVCEVPTAIDQRLFALAAVFYPSLIYWGLIRAEDKQFETALLLLTAALLMREARFPKASAGLIGLALSASVLFKALGIGGSPPTRPIEFDTRRKVSLDDETLRDGLQNPSVIDPSIGEKIEILHLMEDLGIRTYLPELNERSVDVLYGDALDALADAAVVPSMEKEVAIAHSAGD